MPDELDGLQPAAKGGRKRTGRGRFQSKRRTKDQELRAEAAEAAAQEQAEQDDAAASTHHQRPAAELATLRAEVGRLKQEIEKVKKRADSLEYQLESERERSRNKEVCVKELRAAAVESDIAHAAQLAKVCSQRDSLGRMVRKFKAQHSSGSLSAARCRAKARAAKARMARRAFGGLRPLAKRIIAPPVRKSADYRGFKRREVAKLKQYLDKRYEGGVEGETVVHLLNCVFNEFPDVLESVCIERGLYTAVEQRVVDALREHWTVARASFVRVTCKITWRRYQDLVHALGKRWNEETGEHEVVLLPHGTRVPLLPSKNDVWQWESRVAELSGLQLSDDGKRATVDVIQALRSRLVQFPLEQPPPSKVISIQFCGELPGY